MFSVCFWPEQGFGNSAKWFIWKFGQTDLHVCLRKHTISVYFCLEGLGFRVLGFGWPKIITNIMLKSI